MNQAFRLPRDSRTLALASVEAVVASPLRAAPGTSGTITNPICNNDRSVT
jgi:hypothetical protein